MLIQTELDPTIEADAIKDLTTTYRYGRYCEDPSLPLEASRRLILDQSCRYISRKDTHRIAVFDSGRLRGVLLYRRSDWDSDHFGYEVAIIDSVLLDDGPYHDSVEIAEMLLNRFLDWARVNRIRFVTAKLPSGNLAAIHGFEARGFRFIESWIYNKFELPKADQLGQPAIELRLAQSDDRRAMLQYAEGAFATHRFHADAHIDLEKAESLYERWIETAFADPGQQILTADVDGKPSAFMIYYKNDLRSYFGCRFAMWKMAVLDPANRGRGLGTNFFTALIHYHRQEGLDVVDSGLSLRNLISMNLHNKLNFKITATLVTLHKWLEPAGDNA